MECLLFIVFSIDSGIWEELHKSAVFSLVFFLFCRIITVTKRM